mmetsp:Transcript_12984/g.19784  ORF Transcript_12984/g.19784 Transcript_12984/m.19784 type:complete len:207 (+) Transcript_12984:377-997(+)
MQRCFIENIKRIWICPRIQQNSQTFIISIHSGIMKSRITRRISLIYRSTIRPLKTTVQHIHIITNSSRIYIFSNEAMLPSRLPFNISRVRIHPQIGPYNRMLKRTNPRRFVRRRRANKGIRTRLRHNAKCTFIGIMKRLVLFLQIKLIQVKRIRVLFPRGCRTDIQIYNSHDIGQLLIRYHALGYNLAAATVLAPGQRGNAKRVAQ